MKFSIFVFDSIEAYLAAKTIYQTILRVLLHSIEQRNENN